MPITLPSSSTTKPFTRALFIAMTAISVGLAGCSSNDANTDNDDTKVDNESADMSSNIAKNDAVSVKTVAIDTVKGKVDLPINPAPVVVYDMASMQDLAALNVAVAGLPGDLLLDNLQADSQRESEDVGTLFEPDFESLSTMQPQAILIGSRMADKYDALSSIAPTLDMSMDTANIYESSKQRLHDLGALFGRSDKALRLQQDIDQLIKQTQAVTQNKGDGLIVAVNGDQLSAYSDESRFGFVHTILGVPMADTQMQIKDNRHGQPISLEYIQKVNPDWLFVVDTSAVRGNAGAGAQAVLNNPLVAQTTAWNKDQVVYLSPDAYLALGGYYQWMKDLETIKDAFSKAP